MMGIAARQTDHPVEYQARYRYPSQTVAICENLFDDGVVLVLGPVQAGFVTSVDKVLPSPSVTAGGTVGGTVD